MLEETVGVFGLGKLGLPVATQYAKSGFRVIGFDINREVVDQVKRGVAPYPGEDELAEQLMKVVGAGRLQAAEPSSELIGECQILVVMVPVVVDDHRKPVFDALDAAVNSIASGVRPGTLVILETTVPVGTTRSRIAGVLEMRTALVPGKDLFVAFSPERVLTGRVFRDLRRYPKIVGGIDDVSTRRASEFYERALQFDRRSDLTRPNGVWSMESAEAAELVKLAETTYRDVNIALANTFSRYAETAGLDILPVIEAANSQVYSHIHRPGVAVGGHCIPVYPHLYMANDQSASVVQAARNVNDSMASHAVDDVESVLTSLEGRTVLILGAAYRGGVKETAFSGVWALAREISARGGIAVVHDPLFSKEELMEIGLTPHSTNAQVDGVMLQTDHQEYRRWTIKDVPGAVVVYDGRRVLDPANFVPATFLAVGDGRLR